MHTLLSDVLEVHFLDLQAAKRVKEDEKSEHKQGALINWLRFIGTSDKEERAMLAKTSPILQMLNDQVNILSLSPVERKLYESRMKLKSDIVTISEQQFNAGRLEGKLEGKLEGSRQAKLETARLMKQANCEIPFIEKMTGLTRPELEAL